MFSLRYRFTAAALGTIALLAVQVPPVMAQDPGTSASTSKQITKAQRKADRKAARAKKNSELSTLEKNGYNPAGDQVNYPQNLQNAEKKAAAAKGASAGQ